MIKFLITAAFVLVFVFILFLLLSLMAWIAGKVLRYWRVRSADMDCRSCCLFCKYFDICSETCYAEWAQLPWKM